MNYVIVIMGGIILISFGFGIGVLCGQQWTINRYTKLLGRIVKYKKGEL